MNHLRRILAAVCVLGFVLALAALATPPTHVITATLDYDFTEDNACSSTVTTGCLKQFNIYDLSGSTPVKLFSITAPSGASTATTGITGSSTALSLKSGSHTFGATAQMADGTGSDPNACTATALVKPGAPVSFTVSVQ